MDKEKFHNELAMRLGYERIVKDRRVDIVVEESEEPWVAVKIQGYPEIVRIKASDTSTITSIPAIQNEINEIANAVHQAYIEANKTINTYNG